MRIVRSALLTVIAILVLLANAGTVALADGGHHTGNGGGGGPAAHWSGTSAESPGDTGDIPPGQ